MTTAIVWFKHDLRLGDNPALFHACNHYDYVIPVFIRDESNHFIAMPDSASNVWLHYSLQYLDKSLQKKDSNLTLRNGHTQECLIQLVKETNADAVFWNRSYDADSIARDKEIKAILSQSVAVKSFNASLLNEPWEVLKQDDTPYRVFTSYWNKVKSVYEVEAPLPEPQTIRAPEQFPDSAGLEQLELLPNIDWHQSMMSHWHVGEIAANNRLSEFLANAMSDYKIARDHPAVDGCSKLSPHLRFGEISPRQIYYQTKTFLDQHPLSSVGAEHFLSELGWREFAYQLLFHLPHTVDQSLDLRFHYFNWAENYEKQLQRWKQGMTGFPMIDAGMRQLWQTGWMHNRVRMIVASFLTKNLLIPWQEGAKWFEHTLVDADLASNTMGWQWVAGCGVDAAPYFRIFNPILQSERFDAEGDYIRTWVPELGHLDNKTIHLPKESVAAYPEPMVDLKATRKRALDYFSDISKLPKKPPNQ